MQTYDEPAYAADRLVGTIVRYKGKAVKINNIIPDGSVELTYLTVNKRDLVKLKDLDITPVPLGFCNYNGSTTYLSRSPVRQDWKQGLRSRTMRSSSPHWAPDEIPFKVIGKTIENDYPSLENVIVHLKEGAVESMAWHKDFAIDKIGNIYYKTVGIVGAFLDFKERRFQLAKEYRWVLESLEEAVNA